MFKLSVSMGAFQFTKELFKVSVLLKKKSPSPMKREEARRNKNCLKKSNQVYVQETEDKKSPDRKIF